METRKTTPTIPPRAEFIYWVHFDLQRHSGFLDCDFFFHSIAAIYERFSPTEIGCGAERLYAVGLGRGNQYHNARRKVTVRRAVIYRKRHRPREKC